MSVSTSTRKKRFNGSGSLGPFVFDNIKVHSVDDVTITHIDDDGVETVLTTANYTIALVNNGEGGVTVMLKIASFPSGLENGHKLVGRGNTPHTQTIGFANLGSFFPEKHELSYDKQMMLLQEILSDLAQCIRAPDIDLLDDDTLTFVMPKAADRAGRALAFDVYGNVTVSAVLTDISSIASIISEIAALGAITTDITALAAVDTEIAALGPIASDIEELGPVAASVTALAALATEMSALYAIISDIVTLAAISGQISIVAGIETEVLSVHAHRVAIEDCAAALVDIAAAPAAATVAANAQTAAEAARDLAVAAAAADATLTDIAASGNLSVNLSYLVTGAGLVVGTLPAAAAKGSKIRVMGNGAGGWQIAQGAGQQIIFGTAASTSGAGGSIASTNRYDVVTLRCVVANTTWQVESAVGNITIT